MDNIDARKLYVVRRFNYYRPLINTFRMNKYIHMVSFVLHLIVPIVGYILFLNPITFLAIIPIIIPIFQIVRYNIKTKQQYDKVLDGMMSYSELNEMIKTKELYDYLQYILIQETRVKKIQQEEFKYAFYDDKKKLYKPFVVISKIKEKIEKKFYR